MSCPVFSPSCPVPAFVFFQSCPASMGNFVLHRPVLSKPVPSCPVLFVLSFPFFLSCPVLNFPVLSSSVVLFLPRPVVSCLVLIEKTKFPLVSTVFFLSRFVQSFLLFHPLLSRFLFSRILFCPFQSGQNIRVPTSSIVL